MPSMINKQIKTISLGQALDAYEIKGLLRYLGLRIPIGKLLISILYCILSILLFLFLLGVFPIFKGYYPIAFIEIILTVSFLVFINYRYQHKRLLQYMKALDEFYSIHLSSYQEMDRYYTWFIPNPESYLKKNSVLLLTDSYYFVILEDFLISTGFEVKRGFKTEYNERTILKVPDADALSKRIQEFKLSDIESYKVYGEIINDAPHQKEMEFFHVFDKPKYDNYLLITLKDMRTYKLGTNMYEVFKKIIPFKES